jgi:hypothetical protein
MSYLLYISIQIMSMLILQKLLRFAILSGFLAHEILGYFIPIQIYDIIMKLNKENKVGKPASTS